MPKKFYFLLILLFLCLPAFAVNENIPRPEYPRPQFERNEWVNLNGKWTFTFDFGNSGQDRKLNKSKGFDRGIVVPYCPEELKEKLTPGPETGLPPRDQPDKDTDYEGQPYFVDEYGSIKWAPKMKADSDLVSWGYGDNPKTLEEFYQRLESLTNVIIGFDFISGYCYTQLTDVEQEQNGIIIMTVPGNSICNV